MYLSRRILCIIQFAMLQLLAGSTLLAQADAEKNVSVTTEHKDGYHYVYIENGNPFDITLTLEVSGTNIRTSRPTPLQEVIEPESRARVLQIYPADRDKSYNFGTNYKWFMGDIEARHNDSYIYNLPYRRGETYRLGQGFNGKFSHSDRASFALDFMMPVGTQVRAAREGVVIQTRSDSDKGGPSREFTDHANFIVIRHNDGTLGEYAHFKKNGITVKPGEKVRKGELIGYSGNTGYSSGPHLHFMVTKVTVHGNTQSLPIKFRSKKGIIRDPKEGEEYQSI